MGTRTIRTGVSRDKIMAMKLRILAADDTPMYLTINGTTVGKNGNNRVRTDVQLVQFFLKKFYEQQPYIRQLSGLSGIKIDGIAGSQTAKGILWFQKANLGTGKSVTADGLVNVMTPSGVSPTQHTVYTIVHLNVYFRKQGEGNEHYRNLEKHPDIIAYAPELHAELSGQKFLE